MWVHFRSRIDPQKFWLWLYRDRDTQNYVTQKMRKHLCAINMNDNQTDAWKDDKEINFMKEEPILHIEIFMVCIYIFYMKLFNCIVYCMAEQLFRCRTACCIYNLGQKRKPCWQNTAYHVWCYNLLFISYWFLSQENLGNCVWI